MAFIIQTRPWGRGKKWRDAEILDVVDVAQAVERTKTAIRYAQYHNRYTRLIERTEKEIEL